MQLRQEAEQNESRLKMELRKAQAAAADALEKAQAAEEMKMKKLAGTKELKGQLATALQQVESGKMQIQQLTVMLAKAVSSGAVPASAFAGKR